MKNDPRPDGAAILRMAQARRRRARILKLSALVLVAAIAAAIAVHRIASEGEPPFRFITVNSAIGDLREVVTATGTLKGLDSVDVGAQISGRIERVLVEVNDEVKAGDVLAEIDRAQLLSRVEQSRAQVSAAIAALALAKATAEQARAQAERTRDLNSQGLASNQDLEAAVADAERAKANVASSQAQGTLSRASLKDAETQLSYTMIRAPIDGIVLARLVEPGQTVAATLQSPVLFTIARDLAQLELRVDIDEADVGRVQRGQTASFVVDAWPAEVFASKVVNVHNLPTSGQTVVTYQGVLSVDNQALKLRPGMTATATIVTSEKTAVHMVPNAAIRFAPPAAPKASAGPPRLPIMPVSPRRGFQAQRSPEKAGAPNEETVWVLRGTEPAPVRITVGGTDGRFTEVTGGDLQPNTPVIIDAEQAKKR